MHTEAARENARQSDGKFGAQVKDESDVDLVTIEVNEPTEEALAIAQAIRARDTLPGFTAFSDDGLVVTYFPRHGSPIEITHSCTLPASGPAYRIESVDELVKIDHFPFGSESADLHSVAARVEEVHRQALAVSAWQAASTGPLAAMRAKAGVFCGAGGALDAEDEDGNYVSVGDFRLSDPDYGSNLSGVVAVIGDDEFIIGVDSDDRDAPLGVIDTARGRRLPAWMARSVGAHVESAVADHVGSLRRALVAARANAKHLTLAEYGA